MEIDQQVSYVIEQIRQIRMSKSISQLELAQRANISQSFLASLETGKKQPSVETIIKLSKALEVNPGDLFPVNSKNKEQIKNQIISLLNNL